jgi:diamine N-acetyltransferase
MENAERFVIRRCGVGDALRLSLLAQATVLETYAGITRGEDLVTHTSTELREQDFAGLLKSDGVAAWLLETEKGGCPIGYALAVSDPGARLFASFELRKLYVFYRYHGRGLGKRLIEETLAFGREKKSAKLWLDVHDANVYAIEFYRRMGFVQTGTGMFPAGDHGYRTLIFTRAV